MHKGPCPVLPFCFPMQLPIEDENCSTSSSLLRSKDFESKESDFQQEISKIFLMKDLEEKKEIGQLKALPNTRFGRARARSSSPVRDNLSVLGRNHFLFPTGSPVAARGRNIVDFTGVEEDQEHSEEDEDLEMMKQMYSEMLEREEEAVEEDVPTLKSVVHIQCNINNLNFKF